MPGPGGAAPGHAPGGGGRPDTRRRRPRRARPVLAGPGIAPVGGVLATGRGGHRGGHGGGAGPPDAARSTICTTPWRASALARSSRRPRATRPASTCRCGRPANGDMTATAIISPSGTGYLMAADLPTLASDRTYQLLGRERRQGDLAGSAGRESPGWWPSRPTARSRAWPSPTRWPAA